MTDKRLKIGLIGLGNMGQNHLRVLSMLKHVDLVFAFDPDMEKTNRLAATYGFPVFDNLDSCLNNALDAVVICAPTSLHAELFQKVAPLVPHIFVEKPMAASLAQAQEIMATVKSRNLHVQVGFIERFNPAVIQLKKILESSPRVIQVEFTRTNKLSARITDVDVITDLMIHDIDLALFLNGAVAKVEAHGFTQNGQIAFADAVLTHKNGRYSRIVASRLTEKKIRRIEATCEDVFVDCELMRKEVVVHRQSEIIQKENDAYRIAALQENIEVKPQEALLLELQSFIHNCHAQIGETVAAPDAQAAHDALDICALIQKEIING